MSQFDDISCPISHNYYLIVYGPHYKKSFQQIYILEMLGGRYKDDNNWLLLLFFAIRTNYSKDICTIPLFNLGNYKMIMQLEQNERGKSLFLMLSSKTLTAFDDLSQTVESPNFLKRHQKMSGKKIWGKNKAKIVPASHL